MGSEKETRVIEAAKRVFLRYGYRRVTMQDIAEEAGMSRPALYLIYCNKEEAFLAAIRDFTAGAMREIADGLAQRATIEEKLQFAFEIWTVQPFELMQGSPDAKDLIECGHGFAKATFDKIYADFEAIVVGVLQDAAKNAGRGVALSLGQVAHLLVASTHGLKETAQSTAELRSLIAGLIQLTLAALR